MLGRSVKPTSPPCWPAPAPAVAPRPGLGSHPRPGARPHRAPHPHGRGYPPRRVPARRPDPAGNPQAHRRVPHASSRRRRWQTVTVCVITSLGFAQASTARLADLLRGHWAIETVHYLRSVTFAEVRLSWPASHDVRPPMSTAGPACFSPK
jgi:hypothetical protein